MVPAGAARMTSAPPARDQRPSGSAERDRANHLYEWSAGRRPVNRAELQPGWRPFTLPECAQGRLRDLGDGKIRFDVWVPSGEKGTACAWSPLQVEVWIVGLDELKVSSADDVELVS